MARARARPTRAPHIHKFGGASLADAAAIGHAVGIVRAQRPDPLVVVVSAMSGVTDALLDGAARARGCGRSWPAGWCRSCPVFSVPRRTVRWRHSGGGARI